MSRDKAIYLSIKEIQLTGGICALIDPTGRFDNIDAQRCGVDVDGLYLTQLADSIDSGEVAMAFLSSEAVDAIFVLLPEKLRIVR